MEVGYLEAFSKIWNHSLIEWNERRPTKTFLTDFIHEVSTYGFISTKDILICFVLGVAFTILRYILTAAFFKVRIFKNFKEVQFVSLSFVFSECWFHETFLTPYYNCVDKAFDTEAKHFNRIDCAPDISFI